LSEVVCWKCDRTGHYRTSCPEASEELQKWSEFYKQKRAEREKASQTSCVRGRETLPHRLEIVLPQQMQIATFGR
jgi:hypothetical protein